MTATLSVANDEILARFKSAWDTTGFRALYENVAGEIPTTVAPWARVTVRHFSTGGQTLAGSTGLTRYTRLGLLAVQIFTPSGEGLSEAYNLGKILMDAFEGYATPSQVWFRNARTNEVGPSDSWYQTNFLVDFTYDEMK